MSKVDTSETKIRVLLVDSGTAGLAGLYLEAYMRAIPRELDFVPVVNYHYPLSKGLRYFFRYSERAAPGSSKLGLLRLPVRYVELLYGLSRTYWTALRENIRHCVYAISSNLFLELIFLVLLRASGVKVFLACHDVIPHTRPWQSSTIQSWKRRLFYLTASRLIVHNAQSVTELNSYFRIAVDKISYIPFPIMNIGNLGAPNGGRPFPYGRTRRFLFIGHIRREKGIERLLDAWLQFVNGKDDVELVVAGTIAYKIDFDLDRLRSARVTWISGYIGDEEYANFIKASDCVVFPYIRGTNSGVLSNVASAGVLMVASNIPMFSQSGLVPDACMFNGNDSFGLRSKLEEFYNMAQERRSAIIAEIRRMAAERSSDFERGLLGLVADCT